MKLVRYLTPDNTIAFGHLAPDGSVLELEGALFGPHLPTQRPARLKKLLAPIDPPAILCVGLNYRQHAAETNAKLPEFPVVFMKLPGAIQHPGDPVQLPRTLRSDQVDFEGELVVVIGRPCRNVKARDALHYVLGYTIGNDVSARDWQRQWGGGQFCRGKTFDTFAPLGPAIVTPDEVPNPNALAITTTVNGQVMQQGDTADMIFPVPALIEFLSGSTTLHPGTLIFTGTPHGVGMARTPPVFLRPGDTVEISIPPLGTLKNPIIEEPASLPVS